MTFHPNLVIILGDNTNRNMKMKKNQTAVIVKTTKKFSSAKLKKIQRVAQRVIQLAYDEVKNPAKAYFNFSFWDGGTLIRIAADKKGFVCSYVDLPTGDTGQIPI